MANFKTILISGLIIFVLGVVFLLLLLPRAVRKDAPDIQKYTSSPTPTSAQGQIESTPLAVLDTYPKDDQQEVYSGELTINLQFNREVRSEKEFSTEISPKIPYYTKITNTFPNDKISLQIMGKLEPNTIYSVTIKNEFGNIINSFRFTTQASSGQSGSGYVADYETKLNDQYYPLSNYIPYETPDFYAGYKDRLTLNIYIKNPDIEKVKAEVDDWIKSHGVDPKSHQIIYINQF